MSDDLEPRRVSVLPPSRSLLEAGLDLAFAKLLDRIEPPFPDLMDPRTTPIEFLPYLAADRGVNEWRSDVAESEKRETVAFSWSIMRLSGTRRALELAIKSLGLRPTVLAWHRQSPQGAPYFLEIKAHATGALDEKSYDRLISRISSAKAERDIFSLEVGSEVSGIAYYSAAVVSGGITVVYPYLEKETEVPGSLYCSTKAAYSSTTTVFPQ